jgi:hypothetical protein
MYREGARIGDALDECPLCYKQCCYFASDFSVLGRKRQIRVCIKCKAVSVNGKKVGDVEVNIIPPEPHEA